MSALGEPPARGIATLVISPTRRCPPWVRSVECGLSDGRLAEVEDQRWSHRYGGVTLAGPLSPMSESHGHAFRSLTSSS